MPAVLLYVTEGDACTISCTYPALAISRASPDTVVTETGTSTYLSSFFCAVVITSSTSSFSCAKMKELDRRKEIKIIFLIFNIKTSQYMFMY